MMRRMNCCMNINRSMENRPQQVPVGAVAAAVAANSSNSLSNQELPSCTRTLARTRPSWRCAASPTCWNPRPATPLHRAATSTLCRKHSRRKCEKSSPNGWSRWVVQFESFVVNGVICVREEVEVVVSELITQVLRASSVQQFVDCRGQLESSWAINTQQSPEFNDPNVKKYYAAHLNSFTQVACASPWAAV